MKLAIILTILSMIIGGCSTLQESPSVPIINTTNKISGTQDLLLGDQEIQQLGLTTYLNESDLNLFGLSKGTNCGTEESYSNIVDSSVGQYSLCVYYLNDTQIIIELQKFADYEALNGSYQYSSSHLFSVEGLISENEFGDQSTFRVNNEHDYGGESNPPGVYFYHLWVTQDLYLIHITSKGSEDAKGYITKIGRQILSKLG